MWLRRLWCRVVGHQPSWLVYDAEIERLYWDTPVTLTAQLTGSAIRVECCRCGKEIK